MTNITNKEIIKIVLNKPIFKGRQYEELSIDQKLLFFKVYFDVKKEFEEKS